MGSDAVSRRGVLFTVCSPCATMPDTVKKLKESQDEADKSTGREHSVLYVHAF